jgi:FkbM family methyltransferase
MRDSAPLWVSLSATAIRALPFGRYQAANALARFARSPFLAELPPDLGRSRFVCDLRDTIAREVCFTGRYEPQETQLALRLLSPGMTVADVGANWGYFTLVCAHRVGPAGRVLALEPHPRLASTLRENLSVNEVSHVDVIQAAAGAGDGTMAFVGFDESDGNSGVSRAAHGADRVDFVSRVVALDALLDSRRIARVDLLKLDIEGGELAALDGMSDGLRNARYRFVLLECHPQELARLGTSLDDCLSPFVRAGYQGWRIDHSPAMHRRAAALYVPTSELLAPLDLSAATTDVWPHFLWVAPGEALPE